MKKEVIDNIINGIAYEKSLRTKKNKFDEGVWYGLEIAERIAMHKAGILDLRPAHLKKKPA